MAGQGVVRIFQAGQGCLGTSSARKADLDGEQVRFARNQEDSRGVFTSVRVQIHPDPITGLYKGARELLYPPCRVGLGIGRASVAAT